MTDLHAVCPCCGQGSHGFHPPGFYKVYDFALSVGMDKTPQAAHPVRPGLAPCHRAGTHPVAVEMAHMSLRAASDDSGGVECPLYGVPVVGQEGLALIDRLQAGSGLPHPFEQLLDLSKAVFPDVFIDLSLDLIAVVQHLPCRRVDIFHQVEAVRDKYAFCDVLCTGFDPGRPVTADVDALQGSLVIVLQDIFLDTVPELSVSFGAGVTAAGNISGL